ncbi:MAG: hypothetical protein ACYC1E_10865 [Propionibacteriaceae bacterium]
MGNSLLGRLARRFALLAAIAGMTLVLVLSTTETVTLLEGAVAATGSGRPAIRASSGPEVHTVTQSRQCARICH